MFPISSIPAALPNFMVGRLGRQVQLIVLHTTVGTMEATLATFQNPNRIASAHYVVGLDGQVVNMVPEADTAYHSGNWETNLTSIGIEHVDNGDYNGPRTPELYAASTALVADICSRYGIPKDRAHVRRHSEVSDSPTGCPDALDVDRIVTGSGGLEDDMTPQQEADLKSLVYALFYGTGTPNTDPSKAAQWGAIKGYAALFEARVKAIVAEASPTGTGGAPIDLAPVLNALAAQKVALDALGADVAALKRRIEKDLAP